MALSTEYSFILGNSNSCSFSSHPQFVQFIDHLLRTDRKQDMTNTSTILNELSYKDVFYEFPSVDTYKLSKELKKSFDYTNIKYETIYIDYHYFDNVNHTLESLLTHIRMPLFMEYMEYTVIIVLHRDEEAPHFHRLFLEHFEFDYCHVPIRFDQDIIEL